MSFLFGTINWDFEDFEPDSDRGYEGTMTLKKTITPGLFERLFGRKIKTENIQFRGSNITWYTFPGFNKVPIYRINMLEAYWRQWKYEYK